MIHRGVVPGVASKGRIALAKHEHVHDHGRDVNAVEGLMSVVGAKYTTARGVAERVTDRVAAKLQRCAVPSRTATTPLPGGEIEDVAATVAAARRECGIELPSDTFPHLVSAYGSRYKEVLALCEGQPDLAGRLAEGSPVIGAELVWAVRHEMAVTLADAVIRRTPLGALGYPGDMAVDRAADLVAGTLGWSHDRRRSEVAAFRRFYSAIFALAKPSLS
jgi:glycerol-3-phosphate dehydrogenase